MKLSKQHLVTLIKEVMETIAQSSYKAGLAAGLSDGRSLALRYKGVPLTPDSEGNSPLRDELLAHIKNAVKDETEEYKRGYDFGFKNYWATLDTSSIIKEGDIPEEREFDFSETINKDLDFEGLRGIIELLLDSEGVKYETVVGDDRVYYNFYEQPYEGYYWYQPFDALVDAFNKAGIQNQSKMRLMTRISTPSFRTITRRLDKRTIAIYDNS